MMDLIKYYREIAQQGAARLDLDRPDWVREFAADEAAGLEMRCCAACVLGYVYGDFCHAPEEMQEGATMYGFDLEHYDTEATAKWDALQTAWLDLIGKRLADAGLLGQ